MKENGFAQTHEDFETHWYNIFESEEIFDEIRQKWVVLWSKNK